MSDYARKVMQSSNQKADLKNGTEKVMEFLGFVASQYKEAVIYDMKTMITRNATDQLDGYILAISRCMEHELAWHCITNAFLYAKQAVPNKYYKKFNKSPENTSSIIVR